MWKHTSSIVLVVLLINFTNGQEKWSKSKGVANINCPLNDDPNDPTHLAIPGDCSNFLKCSYGLAYKLSCPRDLHFSKDLRRCESQTDAKCDPSQTTVKPVIGGGGCSFAYKPHPSDCHKVILCVGGVESEIECPGGSSWDVTTGKCSFLIDNC